jgi:hypothetical protein
LRHSIIETDSYLRRRTGDAEAALDLTQGFFADLLARNALAADDAARGKFRTFLLACCCNYYPEQEILDNPGANPACFPVTCPRKVSNISCSG